MKIGFIGCGNMGTAMIRGILKSKVAAPEEMMASDLSEAAREKIKKELGIGCGSNQETARFADVLVLAVKPQFYEEMLSSIREEVQTDTLIMSLAPGRSLAYLSERLGAQVPVIRVMPNTPALIGQGMAGICGGKNVTESQLACAKKICESFGRCEIVTEHMLDVVTGISGSSPAYVFMMIEAMADAAVAEGMPRAMAYEFAAQAVAGSAKMVLESGLHPGILKDQVCSPAGTTIEAVAVLEKMGFRSALIEAVRACVKKAGSM